jgi:predicted RNase H-like HicB family nuclease
MREKGSIRYHAKPGVDRLIRVDYHEAKEIPYGNVQCYSQGWGLEEKDIVIDLKYSLVIEATEDPTFFGFYSPDLEGFTGIGHSIEDCLYQARWGMEEHIGLLKEQSLPVPQENPDPKIIIQNQESLARAS